MNGLGCNLLGYNINFINKAVEKEINNGCLLPLSSNLEIQLQKN